MDLGLSGQVFLVTGGTRGLGRAGAEHLVAEGARVVVSSRSAAAVTETVAALGGPDRATGLASDNADPQSAERLVDLAADHFGRLDGALVSVGGPPAGGVLELSDEAWRAAFESVFLGAVRLARAVARALEGPGAIGLVLSSSVRSPIPGLAISNGLRPGLAMVAKTLADELGPRGVRVFGLLPGILATDRIRELYPDAGAQAAAAAAVPLRRIGDPAEFGRVAAFLLSPAAGYLTGCVIPIDGGSIRSL